MSKRIDVNYGGGQDDVFLSLSDKKLYSYEKDAVEMHAKYGGKQYYQSLSGLSGSGFFTNAYDLVKFGYYRTDTKSPHQHKEIVSFNTTNRDYSTIFGYLPQASHQGISLHCPAILTDGQCMAIIWPRADNITEFLSDWQKVKEEAEKTTFSFYYPNKTEPIKREYLLLNKNCNKRPVIDPRRFIDLRWEQQQTNQTFQNWYDENPGQTEEIRFFEQMFRVKFAYGNFHHMTSFGLCTHRFSYDDVRSENFNYNGWLYAGQDLWYRRDPQNDLQIQAFMITERKRKSEFLSNHIDFEKNINIYEWFSKDIIEWQIDFRTDINKKEKADIAYHAGIDQLKTQMAIANPAVTVSIDDSIKAGNCQPGTENFIKKFVLKEVNTIAELLEHKDLDLML